jgi:hypothetical protein
MGVFYADSIQGGVARVDGPGFVAVQEEWCVSGLTLAMVGRIAISFDCVATDSA